MARDLTDEDSHGVESLFVLSGMAAASQDRWVEYMELRRQGS